MMSARNTADISRRQFLRGDLGTTRNPVRPPWAASESLFSNLCDRCDDCIYACPERVIRFGSGGFPEMDFSERGCTLCGECVAACGGKALTSDPRRDRPWMLVAQIGNECLANRNVVCRSCGESCDARAIRFRLRAGGGGTAPARSSGLHRLRLLRERVPGKSGAHGRPPQWGGPYRPSREEPLGMNVCSCVVHTKPEKAGDVARDLRRLSGVEVHGGEAEGKLVVTVEDTEVSLAADSLSAIGAVKGVINTVLIYHYGGEDIEESFAEEGHP